LIMRSYISLSVKSDWDQLADNVYKIRDRYVSREMWKHYEDIHKENKLEILKWTIYNQILYFKVEKVDQIPTSHLPLYNINM
jgi:hypothetical protein